MLKFVSIHCLSPSFPHQSREGGKRLKRIRRGAQWHVVQAPPGRQPSRRALRFEPQLHALLLLQTDLRALDDTAARTIAAEYLFLNAASCLRVAHIGVIDGMSELRTEAATVLLR